MKQFSLGVTIKYLLFSNSKIFIRAMKNRNK